MEHLTLDKSAWSDRCHSSLAYLAADTSLLGRYSQTGPAGTTSAGKACLFHSLAYDMSLHSRWAELHHEG